MGDNTALTLDVSIGRANFSASGESGDVLKAFEDFQALIKGPLHIQLSEERDVDPEKDDNGGNGGNDGGGGNGAGTEGTSPQVDKVPLRVFLDSKKLPRGNAILALGIAIWAKRYAEVNEIDVDSAKSYWRDSGRKIPANISRDLGSAATEGWLERLPTKGQFSATSYGEKHFDELESAG